LEDERLDVNAVNNEGKSALMVAAEQGQTEMVRRICERQDVDFDIVDIDLVC
jgi:ankyrin repeat protein